MRAPWKLPVGVVSESLKVVKVAQNLESTVQPVVGLRFPLVCRGGRRPRCVPGFAGRGLAARSTRAELLGD